MENIGNKRARKSNYTMEEKNVLLQLVSKYTIIENKRTDAATNADKDEAWKALAEEFNSVSPANVKRDAISLKKAYQNLKMMVRKDVANETMQFIKTGVGVKTSNPLQELTLQNMNKKTTFGLANPFDSDNIILDVVEIGQNENTEPRLYMKLMAMKRILQMTGQVGHLPVCRSHCMKV